MCPLLQVVLHWEKESKLLLQDICRINTLIIDIAIIIIIIIIEYTIIVW